MPRRVAGSLWLPKQCGAANDVRGREHTEIAAVEATGLEGENEDFARPERAAATPDGQRAAGSVVVDHHRAIRQGVPEVIYAEGKTAEAVPLLKKAVAGQMPPKVKADAEKLLQQISK